MSENVPYPTSLSAYPPSDHEHLIHDNSFGMPYHDDGGNPMDKRFDRLEKKVDALSERVDKLEERLDHIEVRMDKLDERMGKIEVCMEKFESRMLEAIKELRAEVSNLRWWFLGSCLAMIAIAIAFAQFQTSWFQNGMVQHREATAQLIERMDRNARERDAKLSKAWERIEANQLRLERLDAQRAASTTQQP